MGISIGGFFVFLIVLFVLAIMCRKWRRKANVTVAHQAPPIRDSDLAAVTGSVVDSCPSTSECGAVGDLEMEDLKNVLGGDQEDQENLVLTLNMEA